MLKLNASFSKKVPAEQEYSSKGYSATIEVELPDGLSQEQLRGRIHETFKLVESSVETEINGEDVPAASDPVNQYQAPVTPPLRRTGDARAGGSTAVQRASAKQVKFLLDIARRSNLDIMPHLQGLGVDSAENLSRRQCSSLIDRFNGIGKAA